MFSISVIIPTHNRAQVLRKSIESVLAQTYPVHEILIVDDGSMDDTRKVVSMYSNITTNNNNSIKYIYQEQQGVSVARNTGIANSTGEWIAFLDSDDLWLPEKLEWQARALTQYSTMSAACATDSRYTNNVQLTKSAFEQIGARCEGQIGVFPEFARRITSHTFHGVYLQALLVRSDLIRSLGGFHKELTVNEDTDFLFHLAQRTQICYVNIPLVEIDRAPNRQIGLTELRTKESYRLKMAQYMYEKWLREYSGEDSEIRTGIHQRLHDIHVGWASVHLLEGHTQAALHSLSEALDHSFSKKAAVKWLSTRFAPTVTKKFLLKRRQKEPPPLL
jgi:glycosyltransferase involved in cell wall biosynthesis